MSAGSITRQPEQQDELVDAGLSGPVAVMHWNPKRPRFTGRIGRRLPQRSTVRVRNFGDLLGPEVVRRMRQLHGVGADPRRETTSRLLSVGSILHFAHDGDVVWGSGVNGRIAADGYRDVRLDVRAVRGPLTAAFLEQRGVPAPAVFGDPALLLPTLMPELVPGPSATRDDWVVVPNLHDFAQYRRDPRAVSPREPWRTVVSRIARARVVYASSLHGLVLAEAFGVPAHRIVSGTEQDFKYEDYALGSGAGLLPTSRDLASALGRHRPAVRRFEPEVDALMDAFPRELWAA